MARRKIEPTLKHVCYGNHKSQILNFWKAASSKPTPLLFMIHGGGWLGGKMDEHLQDDYWLKNGISVISIEYRVADVALLPAPVHDAARALQFVRYKAGDWNIDKTRIAVTGGSAGGATSLWLALHDDLAKPTSPDPIARESTKPTCVLAHNGQSSIDPHWVASNVGQPAAHHGMIWRTVGAKSYEDLLANYSKYKKLSEEFSAIRHLDKGDPPIGLMLSFPLTDKGIHSPDFGLKLKEEADRIGADVTCFTKAKHPLGKPWADKWTFVMNHLKPSRKEK